MDHFFKKEDLLNDSDVNEDKGINSRNQQKELKNIGNGNLEDPSSVFSFDNEFGTNYNFSFSNTIERNEVYIDPRDIFTESTNFNRDIYNDKSFFIEHNKNLKHSKEKPLNSSLEHFKNINALDDVSYNRNKFRHNHSIGNIVESQNNIEQNKMYHQAPRSTDFNRQKKIFDSMSNHTAFANQNHFQNMAPFYADNFPMKMMNNRHIHYNQFTRRNYNGPSPPIYNHQYPVHGKHFLHGRMGFGFSNHTINPTNNSVLKLNRIYMPVDKSKISKKQFKKIIKLKVDGKNLHSSKVVNITFSFKKICAGFNESTFLTYVNSFNETLGIMKIPYKYGTVLSFVFNELKKCGGFYNTSLITWNQLSQVIKHFSWINQIYLFLVYPFEQFASGQKQIRIYEDDKNFKLFKDDFSRFNTTDIDICLSKGKIPDIFFLLEIIDPCKVKIDGIIILLNFFVDLTNVKFGSIFVDNPRLFKQKEVHNNRYNFEAKSLFEKIRKNFFNKLEKIDEKKSLILLKRCILISIEHGKMCKKKYLGFNIDQLFLNMLFNIMVVLKEKVEFDIEIILDFIRFCGKSYFIENSFIFKYCYKLCKTDPVFTLEILSNVKFSRTHNKKFLRRLNKFIIPKVDFFSNLFLNHQLIDDNKLLENIIRSFVCIKSMRIRFKEIFIRILLYYDFVYTNGIFIKKKTSSDLFKIILVMISYEETKIYLYSDFELIRRLKKIPGIRDLV